jgi:chitinase
MKIELIIALIAIGAATLLLSACYASSVKKGALPQQQPGGVKIAAYIRSSWDRWSADQIQGEYLTDLMLAFTTLSDRDYTTLTDVNGSWNGWSRVRILKQDFPNLRVNMSVGGWQAEGFSQMARDQGKRAAFINNCIAIIRHRELDGIDIDWEYPVGPAYWYSGGAQESPVGSNGNPITVALADRNNYISLLTELRAALDNLGSETNKYYYLSTCVPSADWFVSRNNISEAAKIVDFIKLMAYDYAGSWTSPDYHANLYPNSRNSWSTSKAVDAFLRAGVPPEKLILGLATYGKQWQGVPAGNNPELPGLFQTSGETDRGMDIGYSQTIKGYLESSSGFTRYWDDTAKAAFLYNPSLNGGTWVCYLDEEQIKLIADYAKQKGLGGIFYWEWYWDQNADLLSVMHREMTGN